MIEAVSMPLDKQFRQNPGRSPVMNAHPASNPVSLSYVAALRGVKPRQPGEAFAYADVACDDAELLACLAASNPEGKFYGIVSDESACAQAKEQAALRGVSNVTFLSGEAGMASLPALNYLCCDESKKPLSAALRKAIFDLAEKRLQPGGLFHYTYRAYDRDDGALRFLVRELAPEMNADQAKVFLSELKTLGAQHLAKHPETAAKLNQAIAKNIPDEFFDAYNAGSASSGTFDTIVALNPRGFVYAGDSDIPSNYVELSAPAETHDLIDKTRSHVLYEQIKDYILDRTVRSDIWCRQPVQQTNLNSELFGVFTYGIPLQREEVPTEIKAKGKTIDLSNPLYTNLIELMTLMPVSVGDFLSHPSSAAFEPTEIVGAIQILIACGLAQPMRGAREMNNVANVSQPRLVGGFNQYLDKTSVTGSELWMSSPVLGGAIAMSARDALVIQALGRAGLADSVAALLPELQRLAKNPAQAASIMDAAEPTAEIAQSMITDVVSKSIVQWYAYGLLEAA